MPGLRTAERSLRLAAVLSVASLALTLVPLAEAARTTTSSPLPFPVLGTSSVWTGEHVYVFGGRSNQSYQTTILKYDPASGVASTLPAGLPSGRQSTSAIWTGKYAYIFGGAELIQYTDPQFGQIVVPNALRDILRFDPATGAVTKLTDQLPEGVWGTSAVWDAGEGVAYVYGGFAFDYATKKFERKDWIVKFKPGADGVSELRVRDLATGTSPKKLPYPVQDAAVAVVGQRAFLFGGLTTQTDANGTQTAQITDQIVTFNLGTEQVQTLSARLPHGIQFAPAAAHGGDVYIFGGRLRNASASAEVLRFFVNENVAQALPFPLPSVRYAMSAVTDGSRVWLMGGRDGNQNVGGLKDVVTFLPGATEPTAPRSLQARCVSSGMALKWSPPLYDGGAAVTGYAVYRVDPDGIATKLGDAAAPEYTDATATPGARYVYRVSARNSAGTSSGAAEIEITSCLRPPAEPRAFEAYAGDRSAVLRWQPPSELGGSTAVHYRIYRNESLTPFVSAIAATKFTDTGLANGENYTYRVTAFAGTYESPPTEAIVVRPSEHLPAPPANVQIETVPTKDAFKVTWDAAARATNYVVRWGLAVGEPDNTLAVAGTSATITGIQPGKRYWIDVQGVESGNRGPPSDLKSAAYVLPPSEVQGVMALAGPGYVRVSWSAPNSTGGADSVYYRILRNASDASGVSFVRDADRWTNTVWVDRNVTGDESYSYRVVPVVFDGFVPVTGRSASSTPVKVPAAANQPPVAALVSSAARVPVLADVTFDASFSTDPDRSDTSGNGIRAYLFDFGDGVKDETRNPTITHRYMQPGTYTAKVLVKDDRGIFSSRAASVQICVGECPITGQNDIGGSNTSSNNGNVGAPPPATRTQPGTGLFGLPGPAPALVALAAVAAAVLFARRRAA